MWTETKVARILARNTFSEMCCVLPNATWTGHETDLLVVAKDLRLIDVEIKLSKDDLKADAKKDKWWDYPAHYWRLSKPIVGTLRTHPQKIWKHYYAVPKDVWQDDWLQFVQPASGVLLVREPRLKYSKGLRCVEGVKRAVPSRTAEPLDARNVVALARLCTLRLWDTYARLERANADLVKAHGYRAVEAQT